MKRVMARGGVLFSVLAVLVMTARAQSPDQQAQVPVEPGAAGQAPGPALSIPADKIAPDVRAATAVLQDGEMVSIVVVLKDQEDLSHFHGLGRAARLSGVIRALRARSDASQPGLRALLEGRRSAGQARQITYFWVFNGLAVTATPDVIEELAARPEVLSITLDEVIWAPSPLLAEAASAASGPTEGLLRINAPALWELGFRGQGIVVANMDTGVDVDHPDLNAQWRGGTNSWFDPSGQHPATPTDTNGHGTWTMGVIVGRDAGGTAIGVAPDAQWIAVKIFDDQGLATTARIHQGYQWLLDPDGNPNTPDAPYVVNNSWTFGNPTCNLAFQLDLQALRAAGIVPVFAAGNFGPAGSTSVSPANYPEGFAVGATDSSDVIWPDSSRGPSSCSESLTTYPEVVAPGVNVTTTDLYGLYYAASGTSVAAPHVAGALALLLNAYPDLTACDQEGALLSTAVDLGAAGPDNNYGYGRVDVLDAYEWLSGTEILFADGYESGSLAGWTASKGGDTISVTKAAAMVGAWGMQTVVSGTSRSFVVDGTPASEASYHARFYFHPNDADTAGTFHVIFAGQNDVGQGIFAVLYRREAEPPGRCQIRAVVRTARGWAATSWYTISNAPHAIEIAWESSVGASWSLYVDGVLKKTKTRLDTSAYLLDKVRLGACAQLAAGMSGTEHFDAFLSTRDSYIGP